jgi:hypothetical protein
VVSVIPRSSPLFELLVAVEAATIELFVVAIILDVMWFE